MSKGTVEDIYELSPLQRGMLLHSMHDGATDMYLSQHTNTVDGSLDTDALLQAWQAAVSAHPALRASFHWEGSDKPLQVVHRGVSLPVHRHDWTDLDDGQQRKRIDQLRADDIEAGFVLTQPPLQRLHLIRLGVSRHCLIWTYHHVLMDGWSIPIFLNDVMSHYRCLTIGGPPPKPAPPFRSYIAWLQRQDLEAAKSYWMDALAGVRPSHLLAARPWDPHRGTGPVDRRIVSLAAPVERGLRAAAARHQVTVGTVVQAAWAVVLRHHTGQADVTFGCASSGRPVELPEVHRMVGVFANTLPVPVTVPDDGDLGQWLREIQGRYTATRRYEYTPLADIKRWAGRPGGQLFESLLVLENYPSTIDDDAVAKHLSFRRHALYDKTDLPLTLTVSPEPVSEMHLLMHRERFGPDFLDEILTCLHATFEAFATADRIACVVSAGGPVPASPPTRGSRPEPTPSPVGQQTLPATPQEEAVSAVYRDILGAPEIDVTASFFAMGGDSFDAVRAISRLDGATLAMLASHPSVRELAGALGSPEDLDAILRRLTPSDEPSHTLLCVPFGGGSSISYQPLADALASRIALLAVALPGHEPGGDPGLRPLEDVAQECADAALESVDGPLSVYGHSTGVALAVEVARRLESAGRTVERLFVAASYPFYDHGSVGRAILRRRESADALLPMLRDLQSVNGVDRVVGDDELRFVARAASHDLATGRRYFSERWSRDKGRASLAVPITFVAGTNDPATPRFERRYRVWERFGSAVDLETLPLAGHYFHQQQPEALAKVIERLLVGTPDRAPGREDSPR